jgi:hypothetical protein
MNVELGMMARAGVTEVRRDASWWPIEPTPPVAGRHAYHFGATDLWVRDLAARHLRWLAILDYSTPWAASRRGDWRSPPAHASDFALYARALAARYGARGSFWSENRSLPYEPVRRFEVWNEENLRTFWDSGPDAARYAELYAQTRRQIRRVDRSAQVLIGGLTDFAPGMASRYVHALFASRTQLRGNVDGFALHPYGPSAVGVVQRVRAFRQTLVQLGEARVPIDVTEFGWEAGGSRRERWRASMMRAVAAALAGSNCDVRVLAPYDWFNPASVPGGDWGLTDGLQLRPSGVGWFAGLRTAARTHSSSLCG